MSSSRKTILGALVLLGGLLVAGLLSPFNLLQTSNAQVTTDYDYDEVITKTFDVSPGETLWLDTDMGTVRLEGSTRDEVIVTVIKGANNMSESNAEDLFERFELDFDQSSRGVTIEGDYDGQRRWRRGNRLHVEFIIEVPREFDVDIETAGGSISASTLEGEAKLHTAGGSVSADDIDGTLNINTSGGSIQAVRIGGAAKLHTSGGSITASDIDGEVDANTSGGSITIKGSQGDVEAHTSGGSIRMTDIYGTANAHTSGGSITADLLKAPDGPMKLETSGGSITLHLTGDTRVDINARASGGRVRSDLPIAVAGEIRRDRVEGEINGGGPELKLRSSGGGIRIYERD